MELKKKSISEMDDKELFKLNERLRNEARATDLILSIKRYNGEKWEYDDPPTIPTKVLIGQILKVSSEYENETIGGMDNQKLIQFIIRLESQENALRLLSSLKSSSKGTVPYLDNEPISSDTPVEDIYHYQIPGAKHGVRRYQNEDGSWTPLGRLRYGKGAPNASTKELTEMVKRQKMEEQYSKLNPSEKEKRAKEIETINKETDKILRESLNIGSGPKSKVITADYSHLTNDELKKRIERLNLESNYGRLTGDTKTVRSGGDWAREIVQTTGALVAIGSSAAVIYATMKKARGYKSLPMKLKPAPGVSLKQDDLSGQEDYIAHHGIKGQRWGIRRYQNEDGTLTDAGKRRLENADSDDAKYEEQKRKTKKAIIIGVAATAAAAVGTAWYLKRKHKMDMLASEAMKKAEFDRVKESMDKEVLKIFGSNNKETPLKPSSRNKYADVDKKLNKLGINRNIWEKYDETTKTWIPMKDKGSSWLSNKLSIPANIKAPPGSTPDPSRKFVKNLLNTYKDVL